MNHVVQKIFYQNFYPVKATNKNKFKLFIINRIYLNFKLNFSSILVSKFSLILLLLFFYHNYDKFWIICLKCLLAHIGM